MNLFHKIALAIGVPRTKPEIAEAAGVTLAQVTEGLRKLKLKGIKYTVVGYKEHTHYFLPKGDADKHGLGEPKNYESVLNLIDTQEWWEMEEIEAILEMTPRSVGCAIRYINSKGLAQVRTERFSGNRTRYFVGDPDAITSEQ